MAGKQKPVCWAASGPSALVQLDVSEPSQGDCLGQRCLGLNHHTGDPFLPLLTRDPLLSRDTFLTVLLAWWTCPSELWFASSAVFLHRGKGSKLNI